MSAVRSLLAMFRLKGKPAQHVSAKDAKALQEKGAVILDVREAFEWNRAHIEGAQNVPLSDIEAKAAELPKDRVIVVHCAMGSRSAKAAGHLASQGFDVRDMSGGFGEWRDAGLPVKKAK